MRNPFDLTSCAATFPAARHRWSLRCTLVGALLLTTACGRSITTSAAVSHDVAHAPAADSAHAGHHMAAPTSAAASSGHQHDMGLPPVTIKPGALITEADVRFMQGMIAHHAQAVAMTRIARTAGAGPRVLKLAQKIDLSQAGEIVLMQEWLRAYDQFVPDTSAWRGMTMHGMLTSEEMAKLEAAKGIEFDRLFLTFMIRHHEGAIRMVADLFATPRAGQEVDVNVFANDVETTQSAEIALMRQMLLEL